MLTSHLVLFAQFRPPACFLYDDSDSVAGKVAKCKTFKQKRWRVQKSELSSKAFNALTKFVITHTSSTRAV